MSRDMARDLSRNLQQRIGELLARETVVMQHVLTTGEISVALVEASVSMCLTTAATIAATLEDVAPAESFDNTLRAIHVMARSDRERSLQQIAERRRPAA